ncbi:membrane protein [Caballeronia jiangsuensis]|nr:membrane protein [Caballeronia jiangsuensis]
MLTGLAELAAGAMSMATGAYVSVSSQADTGTAALAKEQAELKADGARERRELAAIYVQRGLDTSPRIRRSATHFSDPANDDNSTEAK